MTHDDFYTQSKMYECPSGYCEGGIYAWSDRQQLAVNIGRTGNATPITHKKREENRIHYQLVIQPRNFRLMVFTNFMTYFDRYIERHYTNAHLITLTFPHWYTDQDRINEAQQFLGKRLANRYNKFGKVYKYIIVWEYGDVTGLHCHIIITALDDDIGFACNIYRQAWNSSCNLKRQGSINVVPIAAQYGDLETLCYYLTKNWKDDYQYFCCPKTDGKSKPRRYSCSQSCDKPKAPAPKMFDIRIYSFLCQCHIDDLKKAMTKIFPDYDIKNVSRVFNPYTGGYVFWWYGIKKQIPYKLWKKLKNCNKPTAIYYYNTNIIYDPWNNVEMSNEQIKSIKEYAIHYGGKGLIIFNENGDVVEEI